MDVFFKLIDFYTLSEKFQRIKKLIKIINKICT